MLPAYKILARGSSLGASERLCGKWYNGAEEQGESERRWSNEETQLLKSI